MMRKRHREQDSPSRIETIGASTIDERENDKQSATIPRIFGSCLDRIRQRPKSMLLLTVVVTVAIWGLIRGYYALELWLDDPFLEAKLITPFDYVRVRYFEAQPSGSPRRFTMQHNNTFVINLDSDVTRYQNFQKNAKIEDGTEPLFYQRFSAFRWMPSEPKSGSLRGKTEEIDVSLGEEKQRTQTIQQNAMKRYPFLKYSVQKGLPGTAGCSMSHIQLLEQLVQLDTSNDKYYFVFEDDARLAKELLQQRYVEGPPDADIVILSPTSTKTVRIPYPEARNGDAIRVVQSYGAFAYVVTSKGANKLLRHFRGDHDDPIDVAFHRASGVKMYHPTNGWPQAYHIAVRSTRHSLNKA